MVRSTSTRRSHPNHRTRADQEVGSARVGRPGCSLTTACNLGCASGLGVSLLFRSLGICRPGTPVPGHRPLGSATATALFLSRRPRRLPKCRSPGGRRFGDDEVSELFRKLAAATKADHPEEVAIGEALEAAEQEPRPQAGDLWTLASIGCWSAMRPMPMQWGRTADRCCLARGKTG
jgi:hypothetical protein